MTLLRSLLIHAADMFDSFVLRHRFDRVCEVVGLSSWWPLGRCDCWWCRRCRARKALDD